MEPPIQLSVLVVRVRNFRFSLLSGSISANKDISDGATFSTNYTLLLQRLGEHRFPLRMCWANQDTGLIILCCDISQPTQDVDGARVAGDGRGRLGGDPGGGAQRDGARHPRQPDVRPRGPRLLDCARPVHRQQGAHLRSTVNMLSM